MWTLYQEDGVPNSASLCDNRRGMNRPSQVEAENRERAMKPAQTIYLELLVTPTVLASAQITE